MTYLLKKNIKRFYVQFRNIKFKGKLSYHGGIKILLYHSVGGSPKDHKLAVRIPVEEFWKQLKFLVDSGYKTVTISELISNKINQDSGQYVALTFDDSYKDNIIEAVPIMKSFGMKATFFITTSYIDGSSQKKWTNGSPREYMDWDDVLKLSEMGFEIGSHTVRHLDLTAIDENELRFELEASKQIIYKNIQKEVKIISYPYGRFDSKVISIAGELGYIAGCSSCVGVNYAYTDQYILRRTEIDGYDTIEDFRHKLYGYYD